MVFPCNIARFHLPSLLVHSHLPPLAGIFTLAPSFLNKTISYGVSVWLTMNVHIGTSIFTLFFQNCAISKAMLLGLFNFRQFDAKDNQEGKDEYL